LSHKFRLTRSQVEGIDLSFMQPAEYVHHFLHFLKNP